MNVLQIITAQLIALVSLATASGVLLHDTQIDKAVIASIQAQALGTTEVNIGGHAKVRSSSNSHPHPEHTSVRKDGSDTTATLPKGRDRRKLLQKRQVKGFHGNNFCLPLVGEWV